jgi:hypothetical protein
MTLALFGAFDLSVVTDRLVRLLTDFYTGAPAWVVTQPPTPKFKIGFNGSMPEAVRLNPDTPCQCSVYLFHVRQSPSQKNAPVMGRTLTVPFQPLALELFYLVTAWADVDFHSEQRAMSVVLRCFHNNPIVTLTQANDGMDGELVIDMHVETPDELGRVWQAFATPFRLSTVFKVSVVFMRPDEPLTPVPAPVERVVVSVDQVLLFGTSSSVTFLTPSSTQSAPQKRTEEHAPSVVALGGTLVVNGSGLLGATSDHVYILPGAGGAEIDATSWVDATRSSPSQLILTVPDTVQPGPYLVRVGDASLPTDPLPIRSGPVAFSVAAMVGPVVVDTPLLTADAQGVYTLAGKGFVAGSTELLIGAVPLAAIPPGSPTFGQFAVTNATTIAFKPPTDPTVVTSGATYPVVVRVNGVESPPAWWVKLP